MKKDLLIKILLVAVLISFGCTNTPKQNLIPGIPPVPINESGAINRLSEAVKIKSVSHDDPAMFDSKPFDEFKEFLKASFPETYSSLKIDFINTYGILITWLGSSSELNPVVLMAHYDVVPASTETLEQWNQPPFSGNIVDGVIWGRGALDDKHCLMAIMESVEMLVKEGFKPKRTIILSFGFDEELGGLNGAAKIVEFLKGSGVTPEFVLDEGGCIKTDGIAGVNAPIALIGISEKGYLNIQLEVLDKGGHSSMPPRHTALGKIARAITKIEDYSFPYDLSMVEETVKPLTPKMSGLKRFAINNTWLTSPVLRTALSKSPEMAATMHTTIAVTQASGSIKSNILPQRATAVVNLRLFPGDTVDAVTKKVKEVIDDPEVIVTPKQPNGEASKVSSTTSFGYEAITKTIRQTLQDNDEIIIAPYLMVGGSDAKHFSKISKDTYRFLPVSMDKNDLELLHGANERIGVKNYLRMIQFYIQLIKNVQ